MSKKRFAVKISTVNLVLLLLSLLSFVFAASLVFQVSMPIWAAFLIGLVASPLLTVCCYGCFKDLILIEEV